MQLKRRILGEKVRKREKKKKTKETAAQLNEDFTVGSTKVPQI